MKHLIGITGRRRSGKDIFAETCIEQLAKHNLTGVIVGFADALKLECAVMLAKFGVEEMDTTYFLEAFAGPDKERYRPFLQWYGTEFKRARDEDYWVHKLNNTLPLVYADFVFVTDVRFENEALYLKEDWDATLLRLRRTDQVAEAPTDYHRSEVESAGIEVDSEQTCGSMEVIKEAAKLFTIQHLLPL